MVWTITSREDLSWVRLSGIMGLAAPIIAFTCILLAISSYPSFSWTDNALSDLGVKDGITAPLFNYGLIVSGVSTLVFAAGLFKFLRQETAGRMGALILGSATIALVSIGIFPESARPTHYYASVAFFVLCPMAMLVLAVAFMGAKKTQIGVFTLSTAIVASVPWVVQFVSPYVSNVAVPETISALSATAWSMVVGFKMLRRAARPHG